MMPLSIFANRRFTGANLTTFTVYAALGGGFFFLGLQLQTVLGYSALEAGAAGRARHGAAGHPVLAHGPAWPSASGPGCP